MQARQGERGFSVGSVLAVLDQGKTQVRRSIAPHIRPTQPVKAAQMQARQGERGFSVGSVLAVLDQGKTQV